MQTKDVKNAHSSYVVISPVRNEAEYIQMTIDSMVQQEIRPVAWVIVNDGSTDETESIVRQNMQKHPWIRLINRLDRGVRQRGKGVIEAFYEGFTSVEVNYDYIVKLDGDVSFSPDYFCELLREFQEDPKLGIAGGGLYEKPDGKTWKLNTNQHHVRGATKMYRRVCFEEIGGLSPSMGWDGIDEWKALSLGWKVRSFVTLKLMHYRYTGAATGYLMSFYEQGVGAYRMGYHPLYIFARGFRRMADQPFVVGGLAMIWAYVRSWVRQEKMLADPTVVRYVRKTQVRQLAGQLRGKKIFPV